MLAKSAVTIVAIGIAVGLVSPPPVSAQTSGVSYCQALADQYQRYVAIDGADLGRPQASARVRYAINRCKVGDDAGSTSILEQALRDAKIALPQRN